MLSFLLLFVGTLCFCDVAFLMRFTLRFVCTQVYPTVYDEPLSHDCRCVRVCACLCVCV